MSAPDWLPEAKRLRGKGLSYQRIAAELAGPAYTTIRRRLEPEFAQRDRETSLRWKQEHREQNREADRERTRRLEARGRCEDCRGPMGIGVKKRGLCAACRHRDHVVRYEELARLWRDGKTYPELMAYFGISKGAISRMLHIAREMGLDVPYRYRIEEPKYPEQKAAA